MDVKVYKKEEVLQPSGAEYIFTPAVIDIIPRIVEVESTGDIRDNVWYLEQLKRFAEVKIEDNKLVINSDRVRYENGNLYVTLTQEQIYDCEIVEGKELNEQRSALSTIFQRGLDPLDPNDGIRWSEAILGEISAVQLMDDITNAVESTSEMTSVIFDTVTDAQGRSFLSYKLSEVG